MNGVDIQFGIGLGLAIPVVYYAWFYSSSILYFFTGFLLVLVMDALFFLYQLQKSSGSITISFLSKIEPKQIKAKSPEGKTEEAQAQPGGVTAKKRYYINDFSQNIYGMNDIGLKEIQQMAENYLQPGTPSPTITQNFDFISTQPSFSHANQANLPIPEELIQMDHEKLFSTVSRLKKVKINKRNFSDSIASTIATLKAISTFEDSYGKKLMEAGKGGYFLTKNLDIFLQEDLADFLSIEKLSNEEKVLYISLTGTNFGVGSKEKLRVPEWKTIQLAFRNIGDLQSSFSILIRTGSAKSLELFNADYEESLSFIKSNEPKQLTKEIEANCATFEKAKVELELTTKRLEAELTAYRDSVREKENIKIQLRLEMKYRKTIGDLQIMKSKYYGAITAIGASINKSKGRNKKRKEFVREWESMKKERLVSTLRSVLSTIEQLFNDCFLDIFEILAQKKGSVSVQNPKKKVDGDEEIQLSEKVRGNEGFQSVKRQIEFLVGVAKGIESTIGDAEGLIRQSKDASAFLKQTIERESDHLTEIGRLVLDEGLFKGNPYVFFLMKCLMKTYQDISSYKKRICAKLSETDRRLLEVCRNAEKEAKGLGAQATVSLKRLNELLGKLDEEVKKKKRYSVSIVNFSSSEQANKNSEFENISPVVLNDLSARKAELRTSWKRANDLKGSVEEILVKMKLTITMLYGEFFKSMKKSILVSLKQIDQSFENESKNSQKKAKDDQPSSSEEEKEDEKINELQGKDFRIQNKSTKRQVLTHFSSSSYI